MAASENSGRLPNGFARGWVGLIVVTRGAVRNSDAPAASVFPAGLTFAANTRYNEALDVDDGRGSQPSMRTVSTTTFVVSAITRGRSRGSFRKVICEMRSTNRDKRNQSEGSSPPESR